MDIKIYGIGLSPLMCFRRQSGGVILVIVDVPHPFSPQRMNGFCRSTSLAPAPAILNAVYDAVGVRIHEVPIYKQKLRAAIQA